MGKKKPTKTNFADLWRDDATCLASAATEESLKTAWDNVDVGTWEQAKYAPDPAAGVATTICKTVCPVREKCLRDALSDNEVDGIRGGYRFENGAVAPTEARAIFSEFGLRARVRKGAGSNAEGAKVSEVRTND